MTRWLRVNVFRCSSDMLFIKRLSASFTCSCRYTIVSNSRSTSSRDTRERCKYKEEMLLKQGEGEWNLTFNAGVVAFLLSLLCLTTRILDSHALCRVQSKRSSRALARRWTCLEGGNEKGGGEGGIFLFLDINLTSLIILVVKEELWLFLLPKKLFMRLLEVSSSSLQSDSLPWFAPRAF